MRDVLIGGTGQEKVVLTDNLPERSAGNHSLAAVRSSGHDTTAKSPYQPVTQQ